MRRVFIFLLCSLLLITTVSAAGSVTELQSNATLASDGTCQISLLIYLTVDSGDGDLRFPLPGSARDITLNGNRASTSRADSLRWVDLSDVIHGPGNYTLNLHYSLPDLVTQEESGLVLTLPLLSGFSYPIDWMEFSVNLPGEPEYSPNFTSTYYPESMESLVEFSINGPVISGRFAQGLKDHETLIMTMRVSEELFPQAMVKRWSLSYDDLLQYGFLILALIYWLIFMRCPMYRRLRRVNAPDGMTAGELGSCMGGLGVDFPMTVLSWAQMGYLTVQIDRHGRVWLHKTMDMGNERSDLEMRSFKTLFGRRMRVDGGSEHFARLSRKMGKAIPNAGHYFKKSSGNPILFRCLAAGIGTVAGYSLAVAFATDTVWQVILAIFLVPLCAVLSWLIQTGAKGIYLRHRLDLYIALGCCGVLLLLGLWAGEAGVAIFVIISQFLAGVGAIQGGRRTETGLQVRNELMGLRHYLRMPPRGELTRLLENNPEYYFDMAPYAVALGVDKAFARQFGTQKLTACPYLEVSGSQNLTARQWNDHLRKVVWVLEERQRKLIWQKLFGK